MNTAKVHDERNCELGEGPLWHPQRKQLFWFDILGKRLLSREADTELQWDFDEYASAAGWIDHDNLLVATESGLYLMGLTNGSWDLLAPLEQNNPLTRSNDGRADPLGGFWIGTMGKRAEPEAGSIYRYYQGELRRLIDKVSIPNAICFSPDGRFVYFADTPKQKIMRQALGADGWPVGDAELFKDLESEGLFPDGAVCDAEGALWNAQWGAGRVARYLPDGRLDDIIKTAGVQSSCPAFGGETLNTLFVTTAHEGMQAPDSAQGRVYALETSYTGVASPRIVL